MVTFDSPLGCGAAAVRALGPPRTRAVLRASRDHFQVSELLSFEPRGTGAHWLLEVEKTGITTRAAVAALARHFAVRPKDVGYAGLKDKDAVARQWLSVPVVPDRLPQVGQSPAPGITLTAVHRHDRKLRQGAGAGNRFLLRLTGVQGERAELETRLHRCAARGVPNYFGPQRFGLGNENVDRARALLSGARPANDRFVRGILISAARAELFNRLLCVRVEQGSWDRIIDGEAVNLAGSRSWFRCENSDAPDLEQRLSAQDIHPTGPLWGQGEPPTRGAAGALEQAVAASDPVLRDGLEQIGARHDRRPLRCRVTDLAWTWLDAATLQLSFVLGSGSYATAVVRELADGLIALSSMFVS